MYYGKCAIHEVGKDLSVSSGQAVAGDGPLAQRGVHEKSVVVHRIGKDIPLEESDGARVGGR